MSACAQWHPNKNGRKTGELNKYRGVKCDSFSACKEQHTNGNLNVRLCDHAP
jgi:hypothetical protein